tara:strand:- start:3093 stop:3464 length:372 start_codon:yes stop_codon:yes gene_type:complete
MEEHVKINIKSTYIPSRSDLLRSYYFFSYEIKIINNNEFPIKLLSRHWNIQDGEGRVEDIYGPGVIGKQPNILNGQYFEYMSYCPLRTPIGFMKGEFRMIGKQKKEFDVKIKSFCLRASEVFN